MMQWYYAVGAFVALVSLLFAAYKLRPDSTRVFVETAKVTLELANDARNDLQAQLTALEGRMGILERVAADSQREARVAKARADALQAELSREKAKVVRLQREVIDLRKQLRDNKITPVATDQSQVDTDPGQG